MLRIRQAPTGGATFARVQLRDTGRVVDVSVADALLLLEAGDAEPVNADDTP